MKIEEALRREVDRLKSNRHHSLEQAEIAGDVYQGFLYRKSLDRMIESYSRIIKDLEK